MAHRHQVLPTLIIVKMSLNSVSRRRHLPQDLGALRLSRFSDNRQPRETARCGPPFSSREEYNEGKMHHGAVILVARPIGT
jgi:hypothetical protein